MSFSRPFSQDQIVKWELATEKAQSAWDSVIAPDKEGAWSREELEKLDTMIRGRVDELVERPGFNSLLLLCQATRQLWEHLLTRRLVRGVAPEYREFFNKLLRSFIRSITRAEVVREELCAPGQQDADLAGKYYKSMAERKKLAEVLLWGAPDLIQVLRVRMGEQTSPVQTAAELSGTPDERDYTLVMLDVTCAWVLVQKLQSWAMELRLEAGPWLPAMGEHVKIGQGAGALMELAHKHLSDKPAGSLLDEWRPRFIAWIKSVESKTEELSSMQKEFAARGATEKEAEVWLGQFHGSIRNLATEAEFHFEQLVEVMPHSVWEKWLALEGPEGDRYLPPQDAAQRNDVLRQTMESLRTVSVHAQCQWLEILAKPESSGVEAPEDAALLMAARVLDLDFEEGARWLRRFVLQASEGGAKGYFQLAAAGAIAAFFAQRSPCEKELVWLFEILDAVHDTPESVYGSAAMHAGVSATLFSQALVVSRCEPPSLTRLDTHLARALKVFVTRDARKTWLQLAASRLGSLLSADSISLHYAKLDALLPLLRNDGLHYPGPSWLLDVMNQRRAPIPRTRWFSWRREVRA